MHSTRGERDDAHATAVLTAALAAHNNNNADTSHGDNVNAECDGDYCDNTPYLTHFCMRFATTMPPTTIDNNNNAVVIVGNDDDVDDDDTAMVLVPVREPLWCVTVRDLVSAFVARVSRRYAALMRVCTPHSLHIATAVAPAAAATTTTSSSLPSASSSLCVDVCMNSDDTLDSLVAASSSSSSLCNGVVTVNVRVRWQRRAHTAAATAATVTSNTLLQRVRQRHDSALVCRHDKSSSAAASATVAAAAAAAAVPLSAWQQCICHGCNDDDEDVLLAEGGDAKRRAQHYAERRALCDAEADARGAVAADEAQTRALLDAREDDAARHVMTLAALRGDATRNGQLAALLRRRRCYPVDTQPLVSPPSPRQLRARAAAAHDAVTQAELFAYYAAHPHAHDDEAAAAAARAQAERERQSYRHALRHAVAAAAAQQQQQALQQQQQQDEQGMRDGAMATLSEDVYATLCDDYLRERHVTARDERVLFRRMTAMMRAVLTRQREAECAAVLHACVASLHVDDVLSPCAYGQTLHSVDVV